MTETDQKVVLQDQPEFKMRSIASSLTPDRAAFELEPAMAALLDRKAMRVREESGQSYTEADVLDRLTSFLAGRVSGRIAHFSRLGGGASKEQFQFELADAGDRSGRYVLRMDPVEAITETDRRREFQAIRAYRDVLPVPDAVWLDNDGTWFFGRAALIMTFKDGVTNPRGGEDTENPSGQGIILSKSWRERLAGPFIENLVALHGLDWRSADLTCFDIPDADPFQAARWQLGLWGRIWEDDKVASFPVAALVEEWCQKNLPACSELVFVHTDYRTGNYLVDDRTGGITAILDWESAHIGDFHEDLGIILQRPMGSYSDGAFYHCGLLTRQQLIDDYQEKSGRAIDGKSLKFYEVLGAFRTMTITLATSMRAVRNKNSHQEALLTWIAACGHIFHAQICDLLSGDTHL